MATPPPKIVGLLGNVDDHLEKPIGAFYVTFKFCCEPCGPDLFLFNSLVFLYIL